jgi:predicted AlkP superfamily pyrophosphatase or phosphodiesterase
MRFALFALLLLVTGCASTPPPVVRGATVEQRAPVTILVSMDAFRPDYLGRAETPNLTRLAEGGASAAMIPSFPTKTFPNHYTIVTGLRPDRHGIVGNKMRDPAHPGKTFTMASDESWWWDEAEPIWVAAERAGIRSATQSWPGSVAAIRGVRPEDWTAHADEITSRQRADVIIDWLRRPAATRPKLLTLYLQKVDDVSHDFGPHAVETMAAVREVDAAIGYLVEQLRVLGQPANLVVVSDHGMAETSRERVVRLDHIADPKSFEVLDEGVYAAIYPVGGREAEARKLLGRHGHAGCWTPEQIPARYHYGRNPRVPPILCLADVGWLVYAKDKDEIDRGNHGYDNADPAMRAVFIANGPAIRSAGRLPEFDNVDVYPLLRGLLKLPPAQGLDGDDRLLALLR